MKGFTVLLFSAVLLLSYEGLSTEAFALPSSISSKRGDYVNVSARVDNNNVVYSSRTLQNSEGFNIKIETESYVDNNILVEKIRIYKNGSKDYWEHRIITNLVDGNSLPIVNA